MRYGILLLLIFALHSEARVWTEKESGRQIIADVVKVYSRQEVVLKKENRETITIPFDIFIPTDVEHLEYLLKHRHRGLLHPVHWQEMNACFGIDLWQDEWLWDDTTSNTAHRLHVQFESKTDFMENYRGYMNGETHILREPAYATALYGKENQVDSFNITFLNQGDAPYHRREEAKEAIEAAAERLEITLRQRLGKPRRDSIGRGDLREKVWRWDWNHHALLLSHMEGKFVTLRIMPCERAERGGRSDKLGYSALRKRVASCVKTLPNGDVIIKNIPMINQGAKGYCSPATWERYLRYFDIPADMYLIAVVANTSAGGGTYSHEIKKAMQPLLSTYGRDLIELESRIEMDEIAKQIDCGLPLMWSFISTPRFQAIANHNNAIRSGKEPEEPLLDIEALEFRRGGGHICMIIGYNRHTDECCITDSWGPNYNQRWVPIKHLRNANTFSLSVLRW